MISLQKKHGHVCHWIKKTWSFPLDPFLGVAILGPFVQEHAALDMSTLPNPLMDPRGDPREGTFEIPAPPPEVDDSFIKMCAGNSEMT
jgi:hypothetical protein